MANKFSKEQFDFLYSDYEFLKFLSSFYSSYKIIDQAVDINLSDDSDIVDMDIYIRIILANIGDFITFLNKVMKRMSLCNKKQNYEYIGEIKGHLNISKYVKQIATRSIPHVYPCVINQKNYGTPENIYILFYIDVFCDKLKRIKKYIKSQKINKQEYKELNIISGYIKELTNFSSSSELYDFLKQISQLRKKYGEKLPENYFNQIRHRLKTNKIVNASAYEKTIEWIQAFNKNMLILNESSIKMIRYDKEKFCDRLFEIWIFYSIKKTLVNKYSCKLIEEYGVMEKGIKYTFILQRDNDELIYLYFQKGKELYWTNSIKTNWRYVKENYISNLVGIPDISIKIMSSIPKLIMVDAKNKVRKAGLNSAEIYKMIGYFDNFKKRYNGIDFQNEFKKAFLIFRNDDESFVESLVNDKNDCIVALSVAPEDNSMLNENQYKILCEKILT